MLAVVERAVIAASSFLPRALLAGPARVATVAGLALVAVTVITKGAPSDLGVAALAKEVNGKGWIVFSAQTPAGTWDLFLMRPDGSERRNITNTPDRSEAAVRFSPDGKRMLYRSLPKGTKIDHDRWGFQGRVVIAKSDGSDPVAFGGEGEFTWANWGPEGKRLACLSLRGIEIVDIKTKEVLKKLPRKGYYQQLLWSPDGKWFCGTANRLGERWTVARMNVETGDLNPVNSYQNCTPDWFPDSQRVIFSNRPGNQNGYGWTQLWMADGDGKNRRLVYGEDGRHIYGGALSPDGQYVLFTRSEKDGAGADRAGAPMALMRLKDTPAIGGPSSQLRKLHPQTIDGPVLGLPDGWEPHWTYHEIAASP
jgi:dipeptidyl aminopeptidase/acylaminoacyl peptidase